MQQSLKDAIATELVAAEAIVNKAQSENRDVTGEERAEVDRRFEAAKTLRQRGIDQDAMRKQLAELGDNGDSVEPLADGVDEQLDVQRNGKARYRRGRLGKAFVESPQWKSVLDSAPGGFSNNVRVHSQPFRSKSLITGADDDSAGALVEPQRLGLVDPFYQRPLTLRDLVTTGQTTTDAVEYVRLVSVVNNAAPVPEAITTSPIGAGPPVVTAVDAGLKPESGLLFEKVSTTTKTVAHLVPATKRSLADAAQVSTLIDGFLVYGLEEELETQMVAGDGVGENFDGLAATSGVQTQAAPGAGEDWFTITRRARRKVRIGGRTQPTAFVFNPIDLEDLDLMRDANERFYGAGPFVLAQPTLWGLPIVESESIPAGTAWVGDWKQAVLWDRQQATIQVSDSHEDWFRRNLVAILGELRAAFGVIRPPAFCKITLR